MGRHAGAPQDGSAQDAVRLDARVFGMVQGVGFRYWTMAKAEELGLSGEVTNLDDGSVSVLAEGPEPKVRQLLEWLNSGSTPGRVERVDGATSQAGGHFRGFRAH
ncbi:acylphosphatase [Arthrobacter sp. SLBN-112]|jgi:acylphosphatase|uniref:acylphosphatase n=1 Tax=Arthrobacter sp. SLBN-112 TaxID=2768452 RepID=UPI0027AEE36D|nr:acylphosphatase [Arthrobacter sp. SLBN-112]MDQ0802311.1 acylphosphatase [Arthrobacter sp. SLBN-112]